MKAIWIVSTFWMLLSPVAPSIIPSTIVAIRKSVLEIPCCWLPAVIRLRAVPVGEFVRAKQNCSNNESFLYECKVVTAKLKDCGYKQWHIDRAMLLASVKERSHLLKCSRKKCKSKNENNNNLNKPGCVNSLCAEVEASNPTTFVTTFSQEFNSVKKIISKYLPVLHEDPGLAPILSAGCRLSSRHSQTLSNIL